MQFSKDSFTEGFIQETQDHLDSINNLIISLRKDPKDKESLSELLRDVHTIKGTSRILGYKTIEQLTHGIEDVFKGLREEKYELTDNIARLSFETSKCIERCLKKIKNDGDDDIEISLFIETYEKAAQGLFINTDLLENENKGITTENLFDFFEDTEVESLENIKSIRISIERINEIIKSFDDLLIKQFRFKHQLESYEKKLNEMEGIAAKDRALPKQLKEEMLLTEDSIFSLQHQLLNLRMLPLDIILTPLKKAIEIDSISLGKNVLFDIPHSDFMLDKYILEKLREILLHLVRNSLDHGIESVEERIASGKPEKGLISIKANQVSNFVNISVSDDGRGIQYESIRKKAIKIYPNQKEEILKMNERELQQFIFMSGFTTKETASELSGRGVGLDIVRSIIEKIKGKLHLKSEEGVGTTIELSLPLSLATQQGLFIKSSNISFMIPSHYIQKIIDNESEKIISKQGQQFINNAGQLLPLYYLSSILTDEKRKAKHSIIIVEYLETIMALAVDSIEKYETVVIIPLPPLLKNMKLLQGVVYDENYEIISILNIPAIMQKMKGLLAYDLKKYEIKNERKTYSALIVDDSVTTRQIEQTIFESEGFDVITAIDGIDALDKLNENHIDIVITDISMPRMDGDTLLGNMRRMEGYEKTPVIVVSGVYDKTQEQNFITSGKAQRFIVKSEFERGNLILAAKELLNEI